MAARSAQLIRRARLSGMVVATASLLWLGSAVVHPHYRRVSAPSPSFSAPAPSSAAPSPPAISPAAPSRPLPPPAKLKVAALGDSVTAGSNCACTPFPQLYGTALESRYGSSVEVANDGRGGETSDDLLGDLDSDSAERTDVSQADVVLLTIGANDFAGEYDAITTDACGSADNLGCTRTSLDRFGRNLARAVEQVRQLRSLRPTVILVTGYWNVFEDGDVARSAFTPAGQDLSDKLTLEVNALAARVSADSGATYVDLYHPFKGSDGAENPTPMLAEDGDHPNAAGHRAIAQALVGAGLEPVWPVRR